MDIIIALEGKLEGLDSLCKRREGNNVLCCCLLFNINSKCVVTIHLLKWKKNLTNAKKERKV